MVWSGSPPTTELFALMLVGFTVLVPALAFHILYQCPLCCLALEARILQAMPRGSMPSHHALLHNSATWCVTVSNRCRNVQYA